jgi:hypothetical protein
MKKLFFIKRSISSRTGSVYICMSNYYSYLLWGALSLSVNLFEDSKNDVSQFFSYASLRQTKRRRGYIVF